MKTLSKQFSLTAVYAIAMALLEAAVVVYLRRLYYPEGFADLLKPIPLEILWTEIAREAATIIMIFAVASLVARKPVVTFAWFIYIFGIWDIFYYVWLKVFLNWPQTLLDWDLLFLIPIPWFAPVLAPVIISLLFVVGTILIIHYDQKGQPVQFGRMGLALLFVSALVIIFSFTIHSSAAFTQTFPESFPWGIFIVGVLLGALGFAKGLQMWPSK